MLYSIYSTRVTYNMSVKLNATARDSENSIRDNCIILYTHLYKQNTADNNDRSPSVTFTCEPFEIIKFRR